MKIVFIIISLMLVGCGGDSFSRAPLSTYLYPPPASTFDFIEMEKGECIWPVGVRGYLDSNIIIIDFAVTRDWVESDKAKSVHSVWDRLGLFTLLDPDAIKVGCNGANLNARSVLEFNQPNKPAFFVDEERKLILSIAVELDRFVPNGQALELRFNTTGYYSGLSSCMPDHYVFIVTR